MLGYIIRRIALAVLTVWLISLVSWAIVQLPPTDHAKLPWSDYFKWLGRILEGNFGTSLLWQRQSVYVIGDRLLLTVVVSLAALVFTWVVALPVGIYSAVRQYSPGDYISTFLGFVGLAVPNFLVALVAMYVGLAAFNVNPGGLFSEEFRDAPWSMARVWDLAWHLPLPVLVIGLAETAALIRIMRANLLDELSKPYVVTARARGLSERALILRYPVRVALNPFVSTVGYTFPFLVSGSVIVSFVLSLPTVGPLILVALMRQDTLLAGTIILLLSSLTVVGTLASDLLLLWLDPRIRLGRQ